MIEREMYLYFGKKAPEELGCNLDLSTVQKYGPVDAKVQEKYTRPPKQFTEDTLLSAMEHAGNADVEDAEKKGMGTPATRAAIIEKLVSSGFVSRDKRNLVPTLDGDKLITILPEEIKSPKLTADWEMKLNEIARGETDTDAFMEDIVKMMEELIQSYSGISEAETKNYFGSLDKDYKFREVYFPATAAEDEEHVYEKALSGLNGWIDCFEKAELSGHLFCGGVTMGGEIKGAPKIQEAYDMGAGIAHA